MEEINRLRELTSTEGSILRRKSDLASHLMTLQDVLYNLPFSAPAWAVTGSTDDLTFCLSFTVISTQQGFVVGSTLQGLTQL